LEREEGVVRVAVDTEQRYRFRSRMASLVAGSEELCIKTRLVVDVEKASGKVLRVRDEW
jgi:hypothetical protein